MVYIHNRKTDRETFLLEIRLWSYSLKTLTHAVLSLEMMDTFWKIISFLRKSFLSEQQTLLRPCIMCHETTTSSLVSLTALSIQAWWELIPLLGSLPWMSQNHLKVETRVRHGFSCLLFLLIDSYTLEQVCCEEIEVWNKAVSCHTNLKYSLSCWRFWS